MTARLHPIYPLPLCEICKQPATDRLFGHGAEWGAYCDTHGPGAEHALQRWMRGEIGLTELDRALNTKGPKA